MSINSLKRKLNLIEHLKMGCTGSADTLAEKLETSRSSIYRDLEELKDIGLEIEYLSSSNTYLIKNKLSQSEILSLILK